jgi:hypothetical protein
MAEEEAPPSGGMDAKPGLLDSTGIDPMDFAELYPNIDSATYFIN